jgi:FkbM family methyltransferase
MLRSTLSRTPFVLRKWIYASPRLHSLASKASKAIYRDDSWQWCRITGGVAEGLWIEAQPRTQKFLVAGAHEPAVERALVAHAAGGTIWDVGAHIGYFVLVSLRQGSTVLAIEPDPANAQRIRAALARNHLDATVVEVAVGAREGRAQLDVGAESSTSRISTRGTSVVMTTLDALYEQHGAASLVKIDVEGLEGEVLQGAERLLTEAKPLLVIELHPWADKQQVFDRLVGYDLRELDGEHVLATPR